MRQFLTVVLAAAQMVPAQAPKPEPKQEPKQEEAVVFRTTTRLVEFSVVALDKQGRAVRDLRKEELEVTDKGKRRPVAFFRFEGLEEMKRKPQPLAPQTFSNRVEYMPGPARNISAIVLDTLNTPPLQLTWAKSQMVRYLKTLAPQTRVAVFHLGAQLNVLHDFTDDPDSLRQRIEKGALQMPLQSEEDIARMAREADQLLQMFPDVPGLEELLRNQLEIEAMANADVRRRRTEQTLLSLEALGSHLAGIPGRKNLIWIGAGISMLAITGAMGFGPHGGFQSWEGMVNRTARKLAQEGVALYVVDSKGLLGQPNISASLSQAPPAPGRSRFEKQEMTEILNSDTVPAANELASVTGGRVIRNTNDMTEGMKLAAEDVKASYTVGFYAEGEPDGKWHSLKVRTSRPGVQLMYRQGFQSEDPAAAPVEWTAEDWRRALLDPVISSAIGVDAHCRKAENAEAGSIFLAMQMEPSQLKFVREGEKVMTDIEIGLGDITATGSAAFHCEKGRISFDAARQKPLSPADLRYTRVWKPAAGATRIRVIVHDKLAGTYGTLDVPLPAK